MCTSNPFSRHRAWFWLFLVFSLASSQTCNDEEFSINYGGSTAFSIDRQNGTCWCSSYQANAVVANSLQGDGSQITGLSANADIIALRAQLLATQQQLEWSLSALAVTQQQLNSTKLDLTQQLDSSRSALAVTQQQLNGTKSDLAAAQSLLAGYILRESGAPCISDGQCKGCCISGVCTAKWALRFIGSEKSYGIAFPVANATWPTTSFTVSFWANYLGTASSYFFSYAYYPNIYNGVLLGPNDGAMFNVNGQMNAAGLATDGQWHYLSWVVAPKGTTNRTVTVYRDAGLFKTFNLASTGSLGMNGALVLGQDQDSMGGGFQLNQAMDGAIRDIVMWNTARTAAQLQTDMTNGISVTTNTMVWYNMDEGGGDVLRDKTVNRNDMDLYGVQWVPAC